MSEPMKARFIFPQNYVQKSGAFEALGLAAREAWIARKIIDVENVMGLGVVVRPACKPGETTMGQVRALRAALDELERELDPEADPVPPDVVLDALLDRDPDGMARSSWRNLKECSQWTLCPGNPFSGERWAVIYHHHRFDEPRFRVEFLEGASMGTNGGRWPKKTERFPSIEAAKTAAREWVRGES